MAKKQGIGGLGQGHDAASFGIKGSLTLTLLPCVQMTGAEFRRALRDVGAATGETSYNHVYETVIIDDNNNEGDLVFSSFRNGASAMVKTKRFTSIHRPGDFRVIPNLALLEALVSSWAGETAIVEMIADENGTLEIRFLAESGKVLNHSKIKPGAPFYDIPEGWFHDMASLSVGVSPTFANLIASAGKFREKPSNGTALRAVCVDLDVAEASASIYGLDGYRLFRGVMGVTGGEGGMWTSDYKIRCLLDNIATAISKLCAPHKKEEHEGYKYRFAYNAPRGAVYFSVEVAAGDYSCILHEPVIDASYPNVKSLFDAWTKNPAACNVQVTTKMLSKVISMGLAVSDEEAKTLLIVPENSNDGEVAIGMSAKGQSGDITVNAVTTDKSPNGKPLALGVNLSYLGGVIAGLLPSTLAQPTITLSFNGDVGQGTTPLIVSQLGLEDCTAHWVVMPVMLNKK